jgi:pimeloyl-ACP methyl ester carboxylesterase
VTTPAYTFDVQVGPNRVRVRTAGTGPPLLMIMGIGGTLEMWTPLATRISGRQLIMFDFPGTGGSGPSFLPPIMSVNALFTRTLLRQLGHNRVDVLGYSWGGLLAQQLAIQHPHSVRRLVLACSAIGLGCVPPAPLVFARMMTPRRYYSRAYFTKVAPTLYGGRLRQDPSLIDEEADRRIGRPPSVAGYAAQLMAVVGYSSLPGLPVVSAPTLILGGDDDPIVAAANQRVMSHLIRRSRLRVIEGAGHLLLLDSPEIAAPLIQDFLGEEA